MAHLLALALSFYSVICAADQFIEEECPRIRKPVDELSSHELMLYVEGLQAIRANGKYQVMVDAHQLDADIHRGSSFFFYHSYYVWEVETQIRNLGGKFECFGLPYYDWTIDAGFEHDPWILSTVFGGNGDPANGNCVTSPGGDHSGNWNVDHWPLRELCSKGEKKEFGCCLKRELLDDINLATATEMGTVIEEPDFQPFNCDVATRHERVHLMIGKGYKCVSCAMATGYAADDPLFMVLHSFVAYLRAVWAACHGYDGLKDEELTANPMVYEAFCDEGYEECGALELDDTYQFGGMIDKYWSITSRMDVTPRKMWNFENWNVKYDVGSFLMRSGLLDSKVCPQQNLEHSAWLKWKKKDDHHHEGLNQTMWPWDEWNATDLDEPVLTHFIGGGRDDRERLLVNRAVVSSDSKRSSRSSWDITIMSLVILIGVLSVIISFCVCVARPRMMGSQTMTHKYHLLDGEEAVYGTI